MLWLSDYGWMNKDSYYYCHREVIGINIPLLPAEEPVSQLVDFICSRILAAVHSIGEPLKVTVKLVRQLPFSSKSLEYFLESLILCHDPKH